MRLSLRPGNPLPLFVLSLLAFYGSPVSAGEPVIDANLFYSSSCPHCHEVITEDLPPLIEECGKRLVVLAINTGTREGNELYQVAIDRYRIPEIRRGVPTVIVGETDLVGSLEIPGQFPNIVQKAMATGGFDWPDLSGLRAKLTAGGFID